MKKQYKIFLNILVTLFAIAAIGIIGYLAYDYISNLILTSEAERAVDEFQNMFASIEEVNEEVQNVIILDMDQMANEEAKSSNQANTSSSSSGAQTKSTISYRNFNVVGSIEIPKTKIKYPVVDVITPDAVAVAVTQIYGPGLNKEGNTVLVAHNYRNGTFFSNNKKLAKGDKIYITDSTGRKVEYTIYNTYTTSDTDFSYATRNTNGKREISLSTCTTDASKRLVIWAKEQ